MAGHRKDVKDLIRLLCKPEHGCTAHRMGDGHWRVTRPGYRSITISASPRDEHAIRNARADVRRHLGVDI